MATTPLPATITSIVDNQGENTLQSALSVITENGQELWIATAFFSLEALNLLGERFTRCARVRLLFGAEASGKQRKALLQATRDLSDKDLVKARIQDPLLDGLKYAQQLIEEKRLEARVYVEKKFHAKAYLSHRTGYPPVIGILGSSNFTRQGLCENVELNVELTKEQTAAVREWYELRWNEAKEDDATDFLIAEIRRQIQLYEPYAIYLKSLLAWGDYVQGRDPLPPSLVLDKLDPHQEDAFRQSLRIIKRENGVLICDGVGLGKSYVALALMEHFLRLNKKVLLIAPLAILDASWQNYLTGFLSKYKRSFASFHTRPITWFGFEPELTEEERNKLVEKHEVPPVLTEALQAKYEELEGYAEQADVVVIDESHNYRKTASQRYVNTLRMLQARLLGRKKVILLTATPLNTEYQDVTAQLRLISQEHGSIGGLSIVGLQREAKNMDGEDRKDPEAHPTLPFDSLDDSRLTRALEAVAIQRSRKTCKELARTRGKELRFPERDDPTHLDYELSPAYAKLVKKTYDDFHELADFIAAYRSEVRRAAASEDKRLNRRALKLPAEGLRLSAYLPDRYRKAGTESLREAQVESFLVLLVFTNVLKQLESSGAAFQGILQAIGAGLCARLHHVFGNEVDAVLAEHSGWIRENLRHLDADDEAFDDPGDVSGEEDEKDWLERAKRSRSIRHGLADFGPETHDVKTWRAHIESDLRKLKEIHQYTVATRSASDDKKLLAVADAAKAQLALGRKVLIFTQSVRTSQYLFDELPALLGTKVERIDSSVQGDKRHRLLHDFSPKYNPIDAPNLPFQELQVLVTTDVLSEGVNLQEAGCILNYDLHWNPVRLIQRIGRVDRRLRDDDPVHRFSILNAVPPKEIEDVINLVGTVEGRKRKISKLLGLDQSFFSAKDEAGTLKEFNAMVEGELNLKDIALESYTKSISLSPEQVAKADSVPAGGFGVWKGAPGPGLFAMFRIAAKETATDEDRARFANVLGRPVLALKLLGHVSDDGAFGGLFKNGHAAQGEIFDGPTILQVLSRATPSERSGYPSDPATLAQRLAALKKSARQTLRDLSLTTAIELHLECWMELNPA